MTCLKAWFALPAFCAVALAWLAPAAHASQWTDIATISSTLGNNVNRLCVGGGSTDLGCPSNAPYISSTSGWVSFGETFNPAAPLDSLYMHITGRAGTGSLASLTLPSQGVYISWNESSGSGRTDFMNHPGLGLGGFQFDVFDSSGTYVATPLTITGNTQSVGIGTTAPRTTLDVSGTLRIADGGETCSATILGAVKYTSGSFYICQNAATGWEQISTTGSTVTTDHIVSGTTSVYANGNGTISLTTNGNTYSNIASDGTLSINKTTGNALVNRITNSSSGTTAYAGYWASNGNGNAVAAFGVGGVSYTSISLLNNRAFIDSNGLLNGVAINAEGADPIVFGTSSVERMRIDSTGNVGIGTSTPSAPLEISGATFAPTDIDQGNVGLGSVNTAGWAGVGIVFSNSSASSTILNRDIVQNGGNLYFGRHTSSSNTLDMTITSNSQVAIRGTLKIADGGETCDATILGAVKYSSGAFYICQNAATGWEQISTSGATTSDHIASSTTSVYANGTGYISLTTGGTTTGYFDTAGRLVAPGVSLTTANGISSTNGYFSGNMSIINGTSLGTSAGDSNTLIAMRQIDGNADNLKIMLRRHTAGADWKGANYRLQRRVDITDMGFIDFGIDGASANTGLGFGSGATTSMVLTGGDLGIGITNPAYRLDIRTVSNSTDAMRISSDAGPNLIVAPDAAAGSWNSLVRSRDGAIIFSNGSADTGNLVIAPWASTGGGLRMLSNGYVGLGIITPSTALEVSGTVSATHFVGDGSGLTGAGDNLGNHTATQDLSMGSNKIVFGNTVSDKETYYTNTYGRGIESGTLTDWSAANFRWRIGGTSVSTGTQYMVLSSGGLNVAAPVISTDPNGIRMVQGNYGTFWRNDGANLYLMLTNSGDQYGTWNTLRPLVVNLAAGTVSLATTSINGNLSATGSVTAASFYQSSDARLKDNIQTSSGLAVVDKLRGVTFNWKKDGKPSAGVIAQEVEKVIPSAVATDDKGMKSVNYQELIAPLIESVKELHKQVTQLQADNARLQAEVEQLRKGR